MILEINSVTKKFGGLPVINKLSFSVAEGQIKSVIGPNGAGKTTLFNLISGAYSPDRGQIIFKGQRINGLTPDKICRLGLARSFQITNIFQGLSVFENIRLSIQGQTKKLGILKSVHQSNSHEEETQEILEMIGLWNNQGKIAGNLSHGDQRHLEIGIALASRPFLLLLDEPTAGMNMSESRATIELIKGFRGKVSMLIIEHDINLVLAVSDEIAVLQNGELLCEGDPETVRNDKMVQKAYLGEEI
jgi:ABC-type branched-subunit amino acid transport system ATPase component